MVPTITDLILYDPDLVKYCNLMLNASKIIQKDLNKFQSKLEENPTQAIDEKKAMIKKIIPKLNLEFEIAKSDRDFRIVHAKLHIWPSFWYSLCTSMLGAGWFQNYMKEKIKEKLGKNIDIVDVLQQLSNASKEKTAVYEMYKKIGEIKPKLNLTSVKSFDELIALNLNLKQEILLVLAELTKIYEIEEDPKKIFVELLLSDLKLEKHKEINIKLDPELINLYSWIVKSQKEFVQTNEKKTYPLLMKVMERSGLQKVAGVAEFIKKEGL